MKEEALQDQHYLKAMKRGGEGRGEEKRKEKRQKRRDESHSMKLENVA